MAMPTPSTTLHDGAVRAENAVNDAFKTGRIATADMLDSAASRLHAGTDSASHAGHAAADRMTNSASYVRDKGARAMVGDIEAMIKAHPGKFLIGAVVVGFLAGRAFRRD